MRLLLVASLLLACLACSAVCSDGGVVSISANSFFNLAREGDIFIKFYAPWCGHCKRLAPTWEQLAADRNGINKVGKVDCTDEGALCKMLGIRSYPTLMYFTDGRYYKYSGPRDLQSFSEFMEDGYTQADSMPIPKESDLPFDSELFEALLTIKSWGKENYLTSLGVVAFFFTMIGICIGLILMICLDSTSPPPPQRRPRPDASSAPPAGKAVASKPEKAD